MKCKKCLYRANCQFLAKHKGAEVEGCTAFKDATDFVEVVRCKDCIFSQEIDRTRPPYKYYNSNCILCVCEDVVGDEAMIYLKNHFCSYGKRKDGADAD